MVYESRDLPRLFEVQILMLIFEHSFVQKWQNLISQVLLLYRK